MKNTSFLFSLLLAGTGSIACTSDGTSSGSADAGDSPDAASGAPLELTADLCNDPTNITRLLNSTGDGLVAGQGFNTAQVQRMIAAPTEGPFYMFNLIRFRDNAVYADGRETDLTGREANDLYAPIEFLTAIGARVVFSTDVDQQIDGDDTVWESVAVVEYPCPVAFFAMTADPAFQGRAIHKDAGVEHTIVMVTNLAPSPLPEGFIPPPSPYPATPDDPAFELIHVMNFHEQAQYEDGVDEPARSGEEAWQIYSAGGSEASQRIGVYPTARFVVQGVLLGDERPWNEVQIVHQPSRAGFQALLDDPTRQAGRYHRLAALADNYSLITYPTIVDIPGAPSGGTAPGGGPLPVTADGTGTICGSDSDCPGGGVDRCLSDDGSAAGFCTREGCGVGECQSPYLCCRECAELVANMLPFEGSACLPSGIADQLTAAPTSCTCD